MSRDVEVLREWQEMLSRVIPSPCELTTTRHAALTAALAALEAEPGLKARVAALEKELDDPTEYGP